MRDISRRGVIKLASFLAALAGGPAAAQTRTEQSARVPPGSGGNEDIPRSFNVNKKVASLDLIGPEICSDWNEIKSWHRLRSATKQGRKQSVNEIERRREAEKARELWEQASAAGLKGERREQWVMGRLGWDARTDESKLRRLLRF